MEEGEVKLVKVHTKENQSDALTKVFPKDSFQMCVSWVGLKGKANFTKTWEHQGGECELRCGTLMPSEHVRRGQEKKKKASESFSQNKKFLKLSWLSLRLDRLS